MFIEIICCFPPHLILHVFGHFIHFMDMVPVSVFQVHKWDETVGGNVKCIPEFWSWKSPSWTKDPSRREWKVEGQRRTMGNGDGQETLQAVAAPNSRHPPLPVPRWAMSAAFDVCPWCPGMRHFVPCTSKTVLAWLCWKFAKLLFIFLSQITSFSYSSLIDVICALLCCSWDDF